MMVSRPSLKQLDHFKRKKNALEYAQDSQIQIFLLMRKVSSVHLFSIQTFYRSNDCLLADSEGPDQTARMRSLIWAFVVRICSKTPFLIERHNSAHLCPY